MKAQKEIYALVICNHGRYLRGMAGDSRAKVQGINYFNVPVVQGKLQGFDIKILTPREIFYCEGKDKEHSFDHRFAHPLPLVLGSIPGH